MKYLENYLSCFPELLGINNNTNISKDDKTPLLNFNFKQINNKTLDNNIDIHLNNSSNNNKEINNLIEKVIAPNISKDDYFLNSKNNKLVAQYLKKHILNKVSNNIFY